MVFVSADDVMSSNAIFAPELATFETVKTVGAGIVTISTLHTGAVAVLNGHDIQQTVHSKVSR